MKLGCDVVVKRRISNNRRVKGFEQVGQVAKYLGPVRASRDGHYVFTEQEKVMKTTRIVPFNTQEDKKQDNELKELGWTWTADPPFGIPDLCGSLELRLVGLTLL